RGEGAWLIDFDGKRYLDGVSSWWVNLFGHANPRINAAIIDQLGRLEHVMLAGFTQQPVVELSERLATLTGLGHVFYGSDGASATEIALKMSFHYWRNIGLPQKTRFASLSNGYHGETMGALGVTDVALFKDVYAPLLHNSIQLPSPDWRLAAAGETAADYALRCAAAAEAVFVQQANAIAAVIVEPLVQGAAGMAMYHPLYLSELRRLCQQYQIHLIADEIAVGFGRTGSMFACEQAAIQPDFMCLSKGITGGYLPLSAVMTTEKVYAAFYDDSIARGFLHSHSYTGNALACRAALAVLDIFADDAVIAGNREQTTRISKALEPVAQHASVRNFRNCGMIWAFEVDTQQTDFANRCFQLALQNGVLLRPIGNTVYLMPPYILDQQQIHLLAQTTLTIVDQLGD
ncbi:MAG: adenosylmethionine--8-amino-7-oxononanoate transaminase, partial [Neisseriaceae bacterium]